MLPVFEWNVASSLVIVSNRPEPVQERMVPFAIGVTDKRVFSQHQGKMSLTLCTSVARCLGILFQLRWGWKSEEAFSTEM